MIQDVWGAGHIAFITEEDFDKFFIVEDGRYAILQGSKFNGPYSSADTFMQECMLDHARSNFSTGDMKNIKIKNIYDWKRADE
jgi:hypothetical protein